MLVYVHSPQGCRDISIEHGGSTYEEPTHSLDVRNALQYETLVETGSLVALNALNITSITEAEIHLEVGCLQ